jgi:hypothetical protein
VLEKDRLTTLSIGCLTVFDVNTNISLPLISGRSPQMIRRRHFLFILVVRLAMSSSLGLTNAMLIAAISLICEPVSDHAGCLSIEG